MKTNQQIFDIAGRVAVITGVSSGLGETFALGLADVGASIVLAARRLDRLEGIASKIAASKGEVLSVACDVTRASDIDLLVSRTMDRFGRVDILVNNAGTSVVRPIEEETEEEFDQVINVNCKGVFLCTQRFGKEMLKAGKGSIINIASILGFVGVGRIPQSSYAASKGAVVNFTREVASQWARRGIRVNAIAPGWFPSELTEQMFTDESSLNFIRRNTPMGRPGNPEELMGALIYLASDASSYTTGQTLVVDGGWTIV
jgi:NAD(P)-dependent dehydrogenase (short-subunit alcohol dehydrogenase family)